MALGGETTSVVCEYRLFLRVYDTAQFTPNFVQKHNLTVSLRMAEKKSKHVVSRS